MKGHKKLGEKLTLGFQFSIAKNWGISIEGARRSKFQILLVSFFLNIKWLNLKFWQEFSVLTLKVYGKFGAKINRAVQSSIPNNWWISLERARRSKLKVLLVCFFLKVKSLNLKFGQEFPVLTRKGYGKFGAKLNCASQSNNPNNWWISFRQAKRLKLQILLVCFLWKVNMLSQKLWQTFHLVTLKDHEKFGGKLTLGFQYSIRKNWGISMKQARRSKFQILLVCFLLKDKLAEPEILTGVSCPDSEGLWEVWGKTESCFPIQAPKKWVNFLGAGKKV